MSHSEDLTVRARILLMMPERELRNIAAEIDAWHLGPTKPGTVLDRHELIEWLMLHWRSAESGVFAYLERARDNFFKYEGAFAGEEEQRAYYEAVRTEPGTLPSCVRNTPRWRRRRAAPSEQARKVVTAIHEALGDTPDPGVVVRGASCRSLSESGRLRRLVSVRVCVTSPSEFQAESCRMRAPEPWQQRVGAYQIRTRVRERWIIVI